jgi:hypothetical protein
VVWVWCCVLQKSEAALAAELRADEAAYQKRMLELEDRLSQVRLLFHASPATERTPLKAYPSPLQVTARLQGKPAPPPSASAVTTGTDADTASAGEGEADLIDAKISDLDRRLKEMGQLLRNR